MSMALHVYICRVLLLLHSGLSQSAHVLSVLLKVQASITQGPSQRLPPFLLPAVQPPCFQGRLSPLLLRPQALRLKSEKPFSSC